jgi:hypothetical protein
MHQTESYGARLAAYVAVPDSQFAPSPALRRPVMSRRAVVSLVLGLFCVVLTVLAASDRLLPRVYSLTLAALGSVCALAIAAVALRDIRRSQGQLKGRAVAGIGLGLALLTMPLSCVGSLALDWMDAISPSVWTADPKVENGQAYDKAALSISADQVLVVPKDAVVEEGASAGRVEVFMEKTLAFGGHPPERMSIRMARDHMGVGCKTEDGKVILATYGEWDSQIEGGAFLRLLVRVPEGVPVERRADLSGPESVGREWHGEYLTKPAEVRGGYWYGPASPGPGWQALRGEPDRDCRARYVNVTRNPGDQ